MGIGSPNEQKDQSFRGPKPIVDKMIFCVIGVVVFLKGKNNHSIFGGASHVRSVIWKLFGSFKCVQYSACTTDHGGQSSEFLKNICLAYPPAMDPNMFLVFFEHSQRHHLDKL